eukprot:TRINITY_DN410_c0_g3_i1.p1 TRINITY_DN410_c0_g3~~TRINITY_DN410_c0_g3_i1.p1  ORF type:complete len:241 (-),score=62.24 TRINITY_DN410_c0_g3_i1:777-1499(-)
MLKSRQLLTGELGCPSLNPPKPSLHTRSRPFGNELRTVAGRDGVHCRAARKATPKPRQASRLSPPSASLDRSAASVNSEVPPLMPSKGVVVPNHDPAKCSVKRSGIVRAYAANTNQGLVRSYNEDRVSIILNILRPPSKEKEPWPKCSFFGVYDGHGGSACADYLRDNLHQFVIREPSFPWNPREALKKGFENAEKQFLELAQVEGNVTERSGSCAVVVLVIEEMCFVANVGDSRAVLSR